MWPGIQKHQSVRLRGEDSPPWSVPNGQRGRQRTGSGRVQFPAWSRGSVPRPADRTFYPYAPQNVSDDSMPDRTPDPWHRPWRVESPQPPTNASCHARVRLHHRGRRLRWWRPRGASERGRRSPCIAHRGRGTDGPLVDPHAGSSGFELRRRPVELVLLLGAAEASRRSPNLSAAWQGARRVVRDQRHGLHPGPCPGLPALGRGRRGRLVLCRGPAVLPAQRTPQPGRRPLARR